MNWRSGLQLRDHDPALRVELSCPPGGCGRTVRPSIAEIIERAAIKGIEAPEQLYLAEGKALACGRSAAEQIALDRINRFAVQATEDDLAAMFVADEPAELGGS